jgi:nucleoid-associated protein YgaU
MLKPSALPFLAALVALPFSNGTAATPAEEYEQVRRIALRDPKVRAAFDRANERLEAKILEIDPSLKSYVERRDARPRPAPTAQRPAPSPARSAAPRRTHTVAAGDTLSGIAQRYGVTTAALRKLNRVADERKLAVGQVLVLPAAAASRPRAAAAPPRKSWWERL